MTSSFEKLLLFIAELKEKEATFSLECARADAIMVVVNAPSQKWEVEFFEDSSVEIEIFKSNGEIYSDSDDSKLKELAELLDDNLEEMAELLGVPRDSL